MKMKKNQFCQKYIKMPDSYRNRVVFADETYTMINQNSVMNRGGQNGMRQDETISIRKKRDRTSKDKILYGTRISNTVKI